MLALLMNYTTRRGDASVDRDWWDDDEWRGTLTKPELRELSLRVPATDLVRSSIAQPAKITVEQLQRVSKMIGDALQGYRTSEILVDVVNFLDACGHRLWPIRRRQPADPVQTWVAVDRWRLAAAPAFEPPFLQPNFGSGE